MEMDKFKLSESVKGYLRKHSSEIITGIGLIGSIAQLTILSGTNRLRVLKLLYKQTGDPKYDILIKRMTKSNNWLRMHGYPMRRKKDH